MSIPNSYYGRQDEPSAVEQAKGRVISDIKLGDDSLKIVFEDGSHLYITDDGQSCCEHRYFHSDDEGSFPYYVGAQFLDAEITGGGEGPAEYDCHETEFLDIKTSKGVFDVVAHNEHNGYYGGFSVIASFQKGD